MVAESITGLLEAGVLKRHIVAKFANRVREEGEETPRLPLFSCLPNSPQCLSLADRLKDD